MEVEETVLIPCCTAAFMPGRSWRTTALFICRVHRVYPAEHHDEIDLESECAELADHLVEVAFMAAGEDGDLHTGECHR